MIGELRALLAAGFDLDEIRPFVANLRAGNSSGTVYPDSVTVLRRKLAAVDSCPERLGRVRRQVRGQLDDALAARVCR